MSAVRPDERFLAIFDEFPVASTLRERADVSADSMASATYVIDRAGEIADSNLMGARDDSELDQYGEVGAMLRAESNLVGQSAYEPTGPMNLGFGFPSSNWLNLLLEKIVFANLRNPEILDVAARWIAPRFVR